MSGVNSISKLGNSLVNSSFLQLDYRSFLKILFLKKCGLGPARGTLMPPVPPASHVTHPQLVEQLYVTHPKVVEQLWQAVRLPGRARAGCGHGGSVRGRLPPLDPVELP